MWIFEPAISLWMLTWFVFSAFMLGRISVKAGWFGAKDE